MLFCVSILFYFYLIHLFWFYIFFDFQNIDYFYNVFSKFIRFYLYKKIITFLFRHKYATFRGVFFELIF